ncbi:MAG: XRE family transcriptional regulator [Lactobacillus sp.]|nr:MAG: XRE family transcriptional regulator [Lactobacillus sp.]
MEYKSFEDYLTRVYYNEIFSAVKGYLIRNLHRLDIRCSVYDPGYISLENFHIRSVSFHKTSGSAINFNATVEADSVVKDSGYGYEKDETDVWCSLYCSAIFSNGLSGFRILRVDDYTKNQYNKEDSLSHYLVPYLYAADLDKAAEDFLRRNYPEATLQPMKLDMDVLLKNMALQRVFAPLPDNVFGKTYFADADIEICDEKGDNVQAEHVTPGTVVINPNASFIRNIGSVRNTTVHECVHWDRHRNFFELQKLLNRNYTSISCEVVDSDPEKNPDMSKALKWMEWQANALAPRILVPTCTAKEKMKTFLRQAAEAFPNQTPAAQMDWAVEMLADYYGVSKISAKIRAIDMGFDNAEGTSVYVNGRYYPAYSFKAGALKRNQTFVIDVRNALFLMAMDPEFDNLTSSGYVIYANGMFAINDPKYVEINERGTPILTRYALGHIDECCLVFDRTTRVSKEYDDSFYRTCFLCNVINSNCVIEATYNSKYKCNQKKAERSQELKKSSKAFKEILENLKEAGSKDFSETLVYHMDRKGITVAQLAERSCLSTTMISNYRNNTGDAVSNIKRDTVVALCIGLNLKSEYAFDLIDKAGFNFKRVMNERDITIKYLIENHMDENIFEWNRTLSEMGYPGLDGKIMTKEELEEYY